MSAMRGRRVGWAVVLGYAVLLGGVTVATVRYDDRDRSTPDASEAGAQAASDLVEAWERSRLATFVTTGTYERRSDVTGAAIASEDVVAQRPPTRLHRQLGGVEGRVDDRLLVCPAPPEGVDEPEPCRLGEPGGRTYAESVRAEVAGLRSLVTGPDALYRVSSGEPGCFQLEQRRIDPRAPFGVDASFCFDEATGAPVRTRVRHEGGVEEVVVVEEVRSDVTDQDLEP